MRSRAQKLFNEEYRVLKPNSSSAEHFSMRHSGIFLPPSHKCNPIQATSGGVTQSRLWVIPSSSSSSPRSPSQRRAIRDKKGSCVWGLFPFLLLPFPISFSISPLCGLSPLSIRARKLRRKRPKKWRPKKPGFKEGRGFAASEKGRGLKTVRWLGECLFLDERE